VPGTQTVTEDVLTLIGTGLSVIDVDANLSTVQLTVANGTLNITLAGTAAISAGANNSGTLTLTGTQADINTALLTLKYQGNANFSGSDALTVLSTDKAGSTDSDSVAIIVQKDTDSDGVADTNDLDDDNDGILDTVENTSTLITQTFGTGTGRFSFSTAGLSAITTYTYAGTGQVQDGQYTPSKIIPETPMGCLWR
jgi:hypothetical protein